MATIEDQRAKGRPVDRLLHACVDDEEWHLMSQLTPAVCRSRLNDALQSPFVAPGSSDPLTDRFAGSVSSDRFQVTLAADWSAFVAYGRLAATPTGAAIVVEINRTSAAWLIPALIAVYLLITLSIGLPTPGIGQALAILLGIGAVIGLPAFWAWEKKRLLAFICASIEATPEHALLTGFSTGW